MTGFEPIAIAALTKGIDFLFGEAGKILEERKLARQKRGENDSDEHNHNKEAVDSNPQSVKTREELKSLQPKTLHLRDIPQEVRFYLDQIHQYRENRRLLEQQAAAYGGFTYAPLIVQNQTRNAEREIYDNCQKLKQLIEEVYGYKITINGLT